MKYESMIQSIIKNAGGEKNVESLTHCMTRLRFIVKDQTKFDLDALKSISGVIDSIYKGGQLQVIVGTHVAEVYEEIMGSTSIKGGLEKVNAPKEKFSVKGFFNGFFEAIAAIFMPIVGALAGAGMVKAVLAVSVFFKWIDPSSQTYIVLFMISDVIFYYLPVALAFTAAKRFNTSPFLALIMAGMLLHPTLLGLKSAGELVTFMGIGLTFPTYSSSVVPILLIVLFQSYVEKFAKKVSPKAISIFFVPLLVILITAPVGLLFLGPLGNFFGGYLGAFFFFLDQKVSWIVPTLVGGLAPLLVMTGMHYSLGAVQSTQRATVGYATILAPGMMASNMSQAAATFAVSVKTKNPELKSLASSTAMTALCGITEPALYGVNMKLKRPLYATMISGSIAGLYAGLSGVKAWSAGTSNIFALPIYIGNDNSFMHICITVAIALTLGFVLSYLFYKDEDIQESKSVTTESVTTTSVITSPLIGETLKLNQTSDDAFKTGAMGKGITIIPEVGKVVAPFDGTVVMLFETKHAIGLRSEDGVEVLIHVGIDTVKLNGTHFKTFVKQGDVVKANQLLIEFDIESIQSEGYSLETPVIITNTSDYLDVIDTDADQVDPTVTLLTVFR